VQQQAVAQTAIDRKRTIIALEDMFAWSLSGQIGKHTFYKNNEMAGYCAVLQGRGSWLQNKTIRRAINLNEGVIQKPAIRTFQNREPQYPHHQIKPI
jgi:hypothetical protein